MSTQARSTAASEVLAQLCALCAIALGTTVILGWALDDLQMKAAFALSDITVKTNTAISFLLCGLSLLLQVRYLDSPAPLFFARLCALLLFLIGTVTLSEHIFNWNAGIDELAFTEPIGSVATSSPNRMGPPASFCFVLLGYALFRFRSPRKVRFSTSERLTFIVAAAALLPTVGYLYGAQELYAISRLTGIALPTATTLIIVAVGVLSGVPGGRFRSLMTESTAGALLVRRLFFPAILVPVLLGYVRVEGQHAGVYDPAFGTSLLVVAFVVIFTSLVWSSGWSLHVLSLERDRGEQEERRLLSEREALLESERAARAAAERASTLKDNFLASVSHELRTPLNAILGWSQLLGRVHAKDPSKIEEGVNAITRNARIQAQLVEDLLDMSRIVSGKIRLDVQQVELAGIVESAVESIRPLAEAKGLRLEKVIGVGVQGVVRGDPGRIQQVVSNLLSNAVKFTPSGGKIQISLERVESHIALSVSDTGEGIDSEFLPHVFDRFRQADASLTRRHGGLGLGLAISKHIVELHGGKISARSPGVGKGATFVVEIPLAILHNVDGAKRSSPAQAEAGPRPFEVTDLKGVRALVVDDEPDAREMVRRVLEECDAEVETAGSADEGLEKLRSGEFDVIVSDIGMPKRDGYEFLREVRADANEQVNRLPAIALTAFARPEDRRKIMLEGFSVHVAKPVEPSELVAVVANLTGRLNL